MLDNTTNDTYEEARRQLQICNACRYCEGYCSAFPAITRQRAFAEGNITQIANLCHNCRGCYYACQYTDPHEFALNLPAALAEVRRESWETYAWPRPLAQVFFRYSWATALVTVVGFACFFALIGLFQPEAGEGFYAVLSHALMVVLFVPAFILPLGALAIGLRRYWRDVGGERLRWRDLRAAVSEAVSMKNLAGGHGEGCNFEEEERFTQARRWAHQAVMYGFLLCCAATSAGTLLHYVFDRPAPYDLLSVPKLFGVTGGALLSLGCCWMLWLKTRADPALGDVVARGAEGAFVALLGFVAISGLCLYAFGSTSAMPPLLALHLGAVLALFLLTPYTKMAHGFFRLAALLRDAQQSSR